MWTPFHGYAEALVSGFLYGMTIGLAALLLIWGVSELLERRPWRHTRKVLNQTGGEHERASDPAGE